ncbi:MAG: GGDEF domain-containing protein [Bacilli bacterium]|nr:GGDEF domain-containing protein [Bacilli bacterium]
MDFYSAIILIGILVASSTIVSIVTNPIIEKRKKIATSMAFAILIISSLCEFGYTKLSGANEGFLFGLRNFLIMFEHSLAPVAVFVWTLGFRYKKSFMRVVLGIIAVNLLLEVASCIAAPFGFDWLIYSFENGVYKHANLYLVYNLSYFVSVFYLLFETGRYSERNQKQELFFLIAIFVYAVLGLSIHIIWSEVRVDWPVAIIGLTMLYTYMYSVSYKMDSLTGLMNRLSYDVHIKNSEKKAQLIVSFDINDFKQINDNYGHAVGDEVIKIISGAIKDTFIRNRFLCYRFGGDEFICITTKNINCDVEALIKETLDKLEIERSKISEYRLPEVAYGYKKYDPEIEILETALDKADQNMYENKIASKQKKAE